MTLVPELQRAADNADAFDKRGASHAIIGPSPSGKTTQALEYAEALKEKGVSDTIIMRDVRGLDDDDAFSGVKLFDEAADSILILDKFGEASRITQARLAASIAGAIESESVVVILTGDDADMRDFLLREPGIANRLGTAIVLEKLSAEQIAEYHRTPEEKAEAAQLRAEQDKRLAEWRESKEIAIGTRGPLVSPATARFTRKPGGGDG